MNWKEYKSRIINLGFEESDAFSENPEHIKQATNRANTLLHQLVEPNEKAYQLNVENDGENPPLYNEFILNDIIPDYIKKSNKAPKLGNTVLADYYYVGDTLFISSEYEGKIDLFYVGALKHIGDDASDETVIDCREDLIPFLELLTAYYMWLDDDERKAIIYYNQFQEMYTAYMESGGSSKFTGDNNPIVTVKGGIDI